MQQFIDAVVGDAGRLDISFDLISVGDVQGTPLVEMGWDDFIQPILIGMLIGYIGPVWRSHRREQKRAGKDLEKRG